VLCCPTTIAGTHAATTMCTYIHARHRLKDCDDANESAATVPAANNDVVNSVAGAQAAATAGSTTTSATTVPSDSTDNTESKLVDATTEAEDTCTAIVPAASNNIVEWQEYIDTVSGCPYYYDAVSGLTVWEKPAMLESGTVEQEQQQQQLSVVPTPPAFYYNARGNRVFCVPRQSTAA
jgi:WW domain